MNGDFEFRQKNEEVESVLRAKLLEGADLLDAHSNKRISRVYTGDSEDSDWDNNLPNYFVDPLRYAQQERVCLMTDDNLLPQVYSLSGVKDLPEHFSSISLIRSMAEAEVLTWDEYFRYFGLLSGYRFHLMPISVPDMICAVLPPTKGGLVSVKPDNIVFLNLPLTLSSEYGVDDQTVITLLGQFVSQIIKDDSVSVEAADEIMAITIVKALSDRDRKLFGEALLQVCRHIVNQSLYVNKTSLEKLDILKQQLTRFYDGFDPMIEAHSRKAKDVTNTERTT